MKKHQHLLSSEDSVLVSEVVSGPMTAAYYKKLILVFYRSDSLFFSDMSAVARAMLDFFGLIDVNIEEL